MGFQLLGFYCTPRPCRAPPLPGCATSPAFPCDANICNQERAMGESRGHSRDLAGHAQIPTAPRSIIEIAFGPAESEGLGCGDLRGFMVTRRAGSHMKHRKPKRMPSCTECLKLSIGETTRVVRLFIEEGHRPRQKAVQPRSHIPPVQRLYLQARLTQTTNILVLLPSLSGA